VPAALPATPAATAQTKVSAEATTRVGQGRASFTKPTLSGT
jgi:hypothetical protein